jgi:hypothetical protein
LFARAAQLNPNNSETQQMLERLREVPAEGAATVTAAP